MLHERKRIVRTQQTEQKYNTLGGDASRVAIFLAKIVGSCDAGRVTSYNKMYSQMNDSR